MTGPGRARFFAREALLPDGWARDVRIEVDERGALGAVEAGAEPDGAAVLAGPVVPGVGNLHCHAFQRAMAGLAERRADEGDSFWTWREAMYDLALRVEPEQLEAIAAQCYVELLRGGYTAVCEFHYLHNDPRGRPYASRAEMAERLVQGARRAGIGLTLLPAVYVSGGFDRRPLDPRQRRFAAAPETVLEIVEWLRSAHAGDDAVRIGVAPHSLRSVPPGPLAELLRGLDALAPEAPVHIHVAEQEREVQECLAAHGARPVAWLLDHAPVSGRWCLVHATHVLPGETARLARSGAVAGLCPTTEANLGDGVFPLPDYLAEGGHFGVGSDSNVSTSLAEELRWLEYGQRLIHRRRNVAASSRVPSVGTTLFTAAVAGGAQAAGRSIGGLRSGQRADFLVLDANAPVLCGRDAPLVLDALVFCGGPGLVRDVVVGGRRVIVDGRHVAEDEILRDFRRAMTELAGGHR